MPVQPDKMEVQSIGVNALDMRRVDVAVDLTPCLEPITIEMVIVGPAGDELCSVLLVENRQWALDKIMHLRQDAQPGEHVLHVGVFSQNILVARTALGFTFPLAGSTTDHG
jgi:hypothetical protein